MKRLRIQLTLWLLYLLLSLIYKFINARATTPLSRRIAAWMYKGNQGILYDKSIPSLVIFSVVMQLTSVPLLFLIKQQSKKRADDLS
jgi:hypothetical protein